MNTKYIIGQFILLTIMLKPAICQPDNRYIDKDTYETYSQSHLSGELFTPAIKPDEVTYFSQDWNNGDIIYSDGRIFLNEKIRYNILLDELLWLEPVSKHVIRLDKEAVIEFRINDVQSNDGVHFRKITLKKDGHMDYKEIFVQELYEGILSLYVFHSLYLEGRKTIRINNNSIQKNIYTEEPVYYLKFPNDEIISSKKIRPRSFYKIMPDKKDELLNYLKNNAPRGIRTQQEILNFIGYLSSIMYQNNP